MKSLNFAISDNYSFYSLNFCFILDFLGIDEKPNNRQNRKNRNQRGENRDFEKEKPQPVRFFYHLFCK